MPFDRCDESSGGGGSRGGHDKIEKHCGDALESLSNGIVADEQCDLCTFMEMAALSFAFLLKQGNFVNKVDDDAFAIPTDTMHALLGKMTNRAMKIYTDEFGDDDT